MPTSIRITIDDTGVRQGLARLLARGENLAPAMDEIGNMLVNSVLSRFQTRNGPDGKPWKPSIRALTEGGVTLTDRGHLRDSITHRTGPDSVEVGTNLTYAAIHQFGGTIKAKTARGLKFRIGDRWSTKQSVDIPARPFLGLDAGDRDEITEILRDHLAEALP